ncbi:MAG TPA: hypothetical protein VLG71_00530 [Candidatus Limnocylindria bacterium]|nr:hypothetical protein [Candidatus Limnocylindria bacterium]
MIRIFLHKLLILSLLLALIIPHALYAPFTLYGSSFFQPRGQITNAARQLSGFHWHINQFGIDDWYGASSFTVAYNKSYRPRRLAEYFFSTDYLIISGSQVVERLDNDLLADYFGLSPTFYSNVLVQPIMKTALGELDLYIGRGNWFFKIYSPLACWVSTRMHLRETVENKGCSTPFPAGYMATGEVEAPYNSFTSAMTGTQSYGDVQALRFGKITSCRPLHKVKVADVQLAWGYNIVNCDNGHVGLSVMGTIPTGNRSTAEFLFEPIVGNGHHGELGANFDGQVMIWEKDGNQRIDFLANVTMSHLFKSRQRRSFDFCANGFGSRYILLKQFDADGNYNGTVLPAINVTTLNCDVSMDFQMDAVFMFDYRYNKFGFDLGYEAWLRSHEKIHLREPTPFATANYGFKGIQNVANLDGSATNATQSTANLDGNSFSQQAIVADPNPPVFIGPNSLNLLSASTPLSFTHKIFWCFSGHWDLEEPDISPFFCAGGEVEFEGVRPKTELPNKVSMAQWGVFTKGGIGW